MESPALKIRVLCFICFRPCTVRKCNSMIGCRGERSAVSFEKLTAGSVSFGCGHTYCNSPTCASRLVDICPECRVPVNARVLLFGALPDVDRLLEQEPAVYDVEQVERAAEKNTKPALEVILQSMFRIATLLLEAQAADALTAENAKASLEEMSGRSEEDKSVCQCEREEMQGQVNRCVNSLRVEILAKENAKASLEEMSKKRGEERT